MRQSATILLVLLSPLLSLEKAVFVGVVLRILETCEELSILKSVVVFLIGTKRNNSLHLQSQVKGMKTIIFCLETMVTIKTNQPTDQLSPYRVALGAEKEINGPKLEYKT